MATLLTGTAYSPPASDLDELLADVCAALQLSPTQYDRAVEHYEAVGRWLGGDGSPIARFKPRIYGQGSIALGTTTRPWTDADEYDVDAVLELFWTGDPMALYALVEQRLADNKVYRDILERKRRCLCLNYTEDGGVFHLDILPSRRDSARAGTCIEVPDRKTPERWQPSNPLGYLAWFDERADVGLALATREQIPLPEKEPVEAKAVLKLAVQLMKRRRDLMLVDQCEDAPRSIVLTTLAGRHYRGEVSVVAALLGILTSISAEITAVAPRRIVVENPTNPDEKFCESFSTEERYRVFERYIDQFRRELGALTSTTGLAKVEAALSSMFGGKVTKRALTEYADRRSATWDLSALRVQSREGVARIAPIAGAVKASGIVVPKNVFYGE